MRGWLSSGLAASDDAKLAPQEMKLRASAYIVANLRTLSTIRAFLVFSLASLASSGVRRPFRTLSLPLLCDGPSEPS